MEVYIFNQSQQELTAFFQMEIGGITITNKVEFYGRLDFWPHSQERTKLVDSNFDYKFPNFVIAFLVGVG